MNDVIATDIVLLPDDQTADLAIRLSASMPEPRSFTLNRTDRLPHISLLHAFFRVNDLSVVKHQLADLATQQAALLLNAPQLERYLDTEEITWLGIQIEQSAAIVDLQALVIDQLRPLMQSSGDPVASYILDPEETTARASSVRHQSSFIEKSSGDRFRPHITLGIGSKADETIVKFPRSIPVHRLALCQLGNFGTCRKLLAEWPLIDAKVTDYTPGV